MKILEAASYVALLVVCSLGAVRLWQYHPRTTDAISHSRPAAAPAAISGRLPVDLTTRKKWIVLVLSTQCHYCRESLPFHRDLLKMAQRPGEVGLVAVFPQTHGEVERYEAANNFFPQTVSGVALGRLEVRGTPTLLLVDRAGKVLKYWEGMVQDDKQAEVRAEVEKL
jgi:hypothetical protein